VEQYLQQEIIVCMDWPAHSPDLDPIEYVWNMLQIALSRPRAKLTILAEPRNALVEEWNNLPIETPGAYWQHFSTFLSSLWCKGRPYPVLTLRLIKCNDFPKRTV
jgi:hypothetical protein